VLILKERTVLILAGIAAICYLETLKMIYWKIDGVILSSIIGAIVFLITRKKYRPG